MIIRSQHVLMIFVVLFDFNVCNGFNKICGSREFSCDNNECIPEMKRCDTRRDCKDGSDENDCISHLCQAPLWRPCKNNLQCITFSMMCNNQYDCADLSDERNCDKSTSTLMAPCNKQDHFTCPEGLCIPKSWKCNGIKDCLHGEDESSCNKDKCTEFQCKDGTCLKHSSWKCDGVPDCKDKSDELICERKTLPQYCTADRHMILCGSTDTCIKHSQVCDGVFDCEDRSDERLCLSANTCETRNCPGNCIQTKNNSSWCACAEGYRLEDATKCKDIDECQYYGTCDQECQNTPGSYKCSCDTDYTLDLDNRTCEANNGSPTLFFTDSKKVRGILVRTQMYFPFVSNLTGVVALSFNGEHIYFTETVDNNPVISSVRDSGINHKQVITIGVDKIEDLSVDPVTGNIYFTDAGLRHIGVCSSDVKYCKILITTSDEKPRGIVLHPQEGEMYWTEWGTNSKIYKAFMDGSDQKVFLDVDLTWPNGIALDPILERLYWVDAGSKPRIESIKLDRTDRRVIYKSSLIHPFSLDVYENRVYWSDWQTSTVESCNRFTGLDHKILAKEMEEKSLFGIEIYHSIIHDNELNPCSFNYCSHMCLLKRKTFSCVCPENKILNSDTRTCKDEFGIQKVLMGTSKNLWVMTYVELGRDNVTYIPIIYKNISAIAYNALTDTIILSDSEKKSIISLDMYTFDSENLLQDPDFGLISALDFDYLGNNIYWCDSKKKIVEVFNLNTKSRKIIVNNSEENIPLQITLIPEEGIMFLGIKTSNNEFVIDRLHMNGTNATRVPLKKPLVGPLKLTYNDELERLTWIDVGNGEISTTSLAAKISNNRPIDHIISATPKTIPAHTCHKKNGFCSHFCLVGPNNEVTCDCPIGMKLKSDNKTCFASLECNSEQFTCKTSQSCIAKQLRCNKKKDCRFGEDEFQCPYDDICPKDFFQCQNGDCLHNSLLCDFNYDCKDKSDEMNCENNFNRTFTCPEGSHMCSDHKCIPSKFLCDGKHDCDGGEDERHCKQSKCGAYQFKCDTGECIPANWACDENSDCEDSSDEHKDCAYKKCLAPKFLCQNGFCINNDLKCNEVDDCGDYSDEISCFNELNSICKTDEFPCHRSKSLCLPSAVRCNGTSECPEHEDEKGCSSCRLEEFECGNGQCISTTRLCDNRYDCEDHSDESYLLCAHLHHSKVTNISCDHEFACKNGRCVDMKLVCNGQNNCGDGSDEEGDCADACGTTGLKCAHTCIKTPAGSQCVCNVGYRLEDDGFSCVDIKECSYEPPMCSQVCIEKIGSYECACYEGYHLRNDFASCKSDVERMTLIFVSNNNFYQLLEKSNSLIFLHSINQSDVASGLDVSVRRSYVYFSTKSSGALHRINLRNKLYEFIPDLNNPQLISVEWISENVYYSEGTPGNYSIAMCNFKKSNCATIHKIPRGKLVSSLKVDAINQLIFFATNDENSHKSHVYKCNLDGTNLQEIFASASERVTSITYDYRKKLLYCADKFSGIVFKMKYDGMGHMTILQNLVKPNDLTIFDDYLYLSVEDNSLIKICPLFVNYEACTNHSINDRVLQNFEIFHLSRQPREKKLCSSRKCDHLCVPSQNSHQCICDEETNTDITNCKHYEKVQVADVRAKPNDFEENQDDDDIEVEERGHGVTVFFWVLFAITVIGGVCASSYYYYKRRIRFGADEQSVKFSQGFHEGVITGYEQTEFSNPMH